MRKKQLSPEQRKEADKLREIYYSKKATLKYSQEDVAAELGVSQGAVSHYLNGKNPLNPRAASAFSKIIQEPISRFSPRLAKEIQDLGSDPIQDPNGIDQIQIATDGKFRTRIIKWVDVEARCIGIPPTTIAEDPEFVEIPIQLNAHSFVCEVDDKQGFEFRDGDLCAVDTNLEPEHGSIVIAKHPDNQEIFLGSYLESRGQSALAPFNEDYAHFACKPSDIMAKVIFKPYKH